MDLDSLPPITKLWALSALALAVAEHVHLVSQYQLWFSPRLVFSSSRHEVWRLVTCFTYFGPLGVDFLFHIFFFVRYSRMLEENHFGPVPRRRTVTAPDGSTTTQRVLVSRKADYLYLLLFSSALLLLLSPLATLPFLGSPLAFVLVYIWSRRNSHVRLSLFGVLVITAPYLPPSLVALSWIISGSAKAVAGDLMGIAVGHLYYFLVDIWPKEVKSGGRNLLATPRWMSKLIDG